jgi:hypothetical protein
MRERLTNMKTEFRPYVFLDDDETSDTYNLWCVRWSEIMSLDGFATMEEAEEELKLLIEEEKNEQV